MLGIYVSREYPAGLVLEIPVENIFHVSWQLCQEDVVAEVLSHVGGSDGPDGGAFDDTAVVEYSILCYVTNVTC